MGYSLVRVDSRTRSQTLRKKTVALLSLTMAESNTITYTTGLGVLATALLIYLIASTIHSWSRLRHVPGPFLAGISSLWELSAIATGREALVYEDLAKRYGSLIRIGPTHVLTDDPDVLRKIAGVRGTYGKDGFYTGSIKHPDHDTMFSTLDIPTHDAMKAKLAGAYGGRETAAMEPVVDDMVRALVQHVRDEVAEGPGRGRVLDFTTVAAYFTMDVIARVAFGREFGYLRTHSDVFGIVGAIRSVTKKYTIPMSIEWLRNITTSKYVMKAFGPKSTDKAGPGRTIG